MAEVVQDRPGAGRHRIFALGGDLSVKSFQVTMSDSYETGGEPLGLSNFFTTEVLGVAIGGDTAPYILAYDKENDTLKAYEAKYDEDGNGDPYVEIAEVEEETDLSAITVPILVWGR